MLLFPTAVSSSFSSSHFWFSPAYASTLHSSPIIWSHHAPLSLMPTSMPVFPFHSYSSSCLPSPSSFPFSPWVHCDIAACPSCFNLLCVSNSTLPMTSVLLAHWFIWPPKHCIRFPRHFHKFCPFFHLYTQVFLPLYTPIWAPQFPRFLLLASSCPVIVNRIKGSCFQLQYVWKNLCPGSDREWFRRTDFFEA